MGGWVLGGMGWDICEGCQQCFEQCRQLRRQYRIRGVRGAKTKQSISANSHLCSFAPTKSCFTSLGPLPTEEKACNWICFSQQSRRLFLPPTIFVQRGFGAGLRLFTAASSRHKSRPSAPAPETLRGLLCRVFALHSAWGKRHNSHSLFNTTSVSSLFLYFNLVV